MMSLLKIALLQILPTGSIDGNLEKGLSACKKAKELGADLALFPELWQIGYDSSQMSLDNAIDSSDSFVQSYVGLAKDLEMAIAITYLGKGSSKPTNDVTIIDSHGEIVLNYKKVHICDFKEGAETTLEPGNVFNVASLKVKNDEMTIGAMICFDREFPESARTLSLKGAEIILTPNACDLAKCEELADARLAAFRGQAFTNMVGMAMTNYPAPQNDGHSCVFGAKGEKILMMAEEEGIALAVFHMDQLRSWRKNEQGVRDASARRPECYV